VGWRTSKTRGKCCCRGGGATHNPHLNGMSGKCRRSYSKQQQGEMLSKLSVSWSMGGDCMLVLTSATAAGPGPLMPKSHRPHLAASDSSKHVGHTEHGCSQQSNCAWTRSQVFQAMYSTTGKQPEPSYSRNHRLECSDTSSK